MTDDDLEARTNDILVVPLREVLTALESVPALTTREARLRDNLRAALADWDRGPD